MSLEPVGLSERKWLELSLAQQSVWLDVKVTGSSAYQLGGWARVGAPLDEAAVRQSVRLLMARHDGLRLRVDDELPRQWVDEGSEPPITVHDLEVVDGADPDVVFDAYVAQVFATSMPLGDEPLFRIDLLRAGSDLHYVLWRFHHLIADSMSVSITLSHWFEAYEALAGNASSELAPTSSYLGTIAADAAYMESATYHQNIGYWASRFDPMPPQLIADLAMQSEKGRAQDHTALASFELRGERYDRFEAAAKEAGTSAQRALFALCAIALGRRYGQTDIVSGIALHRRDLTNRHVLGMMAGVIAVRCDFDPYWTLSECVQAFSEQVDADLRHQRLPVDVLSRALGLSGTGRTGLFEVAMSYMPAVRGDDAELDGLPVTMGVVATREASPVSMHVAEEHGGKGVALSLAVNTDFLDAGEGSILAELLQRAMDRFVDKPDTCFEDLELTTPRERELVLRRWSGLEAEFDQGTLDGLFSAQAARTPEAIAVIGVNGVEVSYAELDARSTRLAQQLVAGGVKAERVVGVRMARSMETVVAILAILKAGGVYLPLDPAYPAERLEYIAADADAMLVLDSLDLIQDEGGAGAANLPELGADGDASRLAYVIYTSGTTGLPKGVAVEHRAAVNLAYARRACHDPLGVGDRVLAAISVGFDVSIGQLLLPLLAGATVVVAGEMKTMEATEFWQLLEERAVTHVNSVPSFLEAVLSAVPSRGLALKRLMLGGEALSGGLVGQIMRVLPGVEVVNMYGPTETCIDATFHVATKDDEGAGTLPIGRPLSNYRTYVLNEKMEAVGVGVSGELYVGGAGLARGYVNAPELSDERFLSDPFSGYGSGRLYRTGDRARWRPDGRLEFLGRGDAQVKIRGFRVEPGEVAARLLGHLDVAQAVVVPQVMEQKSAVRALRLVAYFVPLAGRDIPITADLRAYLAESLPDYMVPSAFVALTEIPLNRNGKLDVGALPLPEAEIGELAPARTATEETIVELFAEVLGIAQCGVNDHFFELGGHSLLAATLVSRLRLHGWTVPLRTIFETPTVEMLARRIDASIPVTREERRIVAQTRPDRIPLSLSQERIWFVDRLQGDSSYNIPLAMDLCGLLDVAAAERALARIIERHEVLRTRIVLREGKPSQEIDGTGALPLRHVDLSKFDRGRQAEAIREHLAELVSWRFDLEKDEPLRISLMTLASDHYVLAAVVHHVAFDGWSAGVFLREFAAFYQSFARQETNSLPVLPIQYADFALWQRGQDRTADLEFWRDELRGAPAHLELPGLVVREPGRRAGTLPVSLDSTLHTGLVRLAGEQKASLFMVLHAAFALLMAQWSGQDDVVIGTVTANRSYNEFEAMIGCFVNTLPLRTQFVEGESFRSLLGRVKHADLAAFAHKDLPFEELVAALEVERSLEHTPIFQVMFVMQNTPWPASVLPGLMLEPIVVEAAMAKFDLTLSLAEDASGLSGSIEFAANRFSVQQIERLVDGFRRVLETIVCNQEVEALGLDVLTSADHALVVEEWNRTEDSFPAGTLNGLFSEQAKRTPEAVAVVDLDGSELDYATLDERSGRLAKQLTARGVTAGEIVGVKMARSAETVVALLGVLKAGAVYLPLDPQYPAERLAYMIADTRARVVLESLQEWESCSEGELGEDFEPERLAYVIYTSGTTGMPKGVAVSHAAAVNLAFARRAAHDPLGVGDRVLAAISVGFDVSIGQLLLPLLCGATVVIAGELKMMGPAAFWAFLMERGVTHINSVPSFLQSALEVPPARDTLSLKQLMLGGEALTGALVERINRALPGVAVVNMYGPTEACIDATYYVLSPMDYASAVVPIGRPLPNYKVYVLDRWMRPAGIGITGELYLGGTGLAEGYVNAPELTAERFVADPFTTDYAKKLYRTGDRARWRDDGVLEFLGRVDEQIKIRGFRVEPGEIEAQLRLLAGVNEAAVVAQSIEGGVRLVAYYSGEEFATGPELLRSSLVETLPEYMVPSAFVWLERLPLSLNGKLDRKALPAPGQDAFAVRGYEAPLGEVEQRTAALWAELLQVERVGRHDNFFELGGHSLLAVTLMERMAMEHLPGDVRTLFTAPTIAGLTALSEPAIRSVVAPLNRISSGVKHITPAMLPLIELKQEQIDRIVATIPGGAENVQDVYPLAPLQEGILFQHRITSEGDPYLTPFLLRMDGRAQLDKFLAALNRLIDRHDVLRTFIQWEGLDSPLQVVLREAALPVQEITFDVSVNDVGAELLSLFDPRSFRLDLTSAPLLRVAYAHEPGTNGWLLLLLTHHLVLDHTSLAVLMSELQTIMSRLEATLPSPSPYRNFIAQIAGGLTREQHEAFFRTMLGDVAEPTAPFGLFDTQLIATTESRLRLQPELANEIRRRSRALGITPASVFHLAWATVLGHVASTTDVVFGTVLFGRMRSAAGGAEMVGMTINTLPLRLRLDTTGVAESAKKTHRLLAELMVHEHGSLALAQRASNVQPPTPLLSSLFNYRYSGESDVDSVWPGIEMIHASERTNYPLAMAVDDLGTAFVLTALSNPGPYAEQACRYLECALQELVRLLEFAPATPVQTIEVLPIDERTLVLKSSMPVTEPNWGTLDGLFVAQARLTPEAVAVVDVDGTELSYAELDSRSTTFARRLKAQLGDRVREPVIGVKMERSSATVIALLSILKAGGVYLPLDPAYPTERLEYMTVDAVAVLVLESLAMWDQGDWSESDLPELLLSDDAGRLAYIIYTSGTTGLPKGVAMEHRAAVNLALARRRGHDPLGPGDRVLAAISVGFDVSIGQLLLPLLSGATVVVAGEMKTMGAREFWSMLAQRRVTHINSVPSFFDSMLNASPAEEKLSLKRVMLGGETLAGSLVERIWNVLPDVEIVNMYGPTETCIDATFHVATREDTGAAVLPIGRSLWNYQTLILNSRMQLVAPGVTGELYVGGAGLARGYVNSLDLTAERFVANPFSHESAGRLYRTGDLARWREDGAIEFLGRCDSQVKIRGFRVEPEEVAALIRQQAGVSEAAVVARSIDGSTTLIAYMTGSRALSPKELRETCSANLPDYMVPSAYVWLDRMPLSLNGKLDYKALPVPTGDVYAANIYEPPANQTEVTMALLWADALKLERIGRHDNFFEVGGDSLSAMRLISAINVAFAVDLPVRLLFQRPTVSALSSELFSSSLDLGNVSKNLLPIQPRGERPPLFVVHGLTGHVFHYMPLIQAFGLDQPVYGLQATGLEHGGGPGASIKQMATSYVDAIQDAQIKGPYHLLGYSAGGLLAFAMAQQFAERGEEVAFLGLLDTSLPDPGAVRTLPEEYLMYDVAGSLGLADLARSVTPPPTLAELVELARREKRLPEGFATAHVERMAEVFRHMIRVCPDYELRPWDGPMLFLSAKRDPDDPGVAPDWSPFVRGVFRQIDLDCGHLELIGPGMARAVADEIASSIADRRSLGNLTVA